MEKDKNFELLLRRKNKLLIHTNGSGLQSPDVLEIARMVIAIGKNIESLGYSLSKDVCRKLLTLNSDELSMFYDTLVTRLKKLCGNDKEYTPFYVNFPAELKNYSDWELYTNSFLHYLTEGTYIPSAIKKERLPLCEDCDLTVLDVGTEEELIEIRNNLLQSKTSLSERDKEDLFYLLSEFPIEAESLPDITYKETLCLVLKWFIEHKEEEEWYKVIDQLHTLTDVLRVAVVLENGDSSLSDKSFHFFKKFSRTVQRFLFTAMEKSGNQEDDMKRHERLWKNFSSYSNISDYKNRFPKTYNTFLKLWDGKLKGYYSKVEEAINDKDIKEIVRLLEKRPGEFARRLDQIIRIATNKDEEKLIVEAFENVVDQISTPVLWQLKEFYKYRLAKKDTRIFFPKGSMQKSYVVPNTVPGIDKDIPEKINQICTAALIRAFQKREKMGRVYVSDSIKGYAIPQSQRSASDGKKIVTRNSWFSIKKQFIRFFIHWMNEEHERTDIDLSCSFLDSKYAQVGHTSYLNLREKYSWHSGDFVDAPRPKGACEFIDLDLSGAEKAGARYAVMQVYGYTNTTFDRMDYLDVGWMERQNINSGEVFEPSLVENRINLSANTRCAIPLIIDIKKRKVIWIDLALTIRPYFPNNNITNASNTQKVVQGIVENHKPQMYEAALLNALARGVPTKDRNKADVIFDVDTSKPVIERIIEERDSNGVIIKTDIVTEENNLAKIITPFDCDIWQSDLI